jgi:Ca2+-binding RTX toxin-like protein
MRAALAIAAVVALATPAATSALTLSEKDGVLLYTASPGEENLGGLHQAPPGHVPDGLDETDHEHFWIKDFGAKNDATLGDGCRKLDPSRSTYTYYDYQCDAAGITSVRLDLGDEGDVAGANTDLPVTLLGGPGDDLWLEVPLHGVADGGDGNDALRFFRNGDATIAGGPGIDTVDFDLSGFERLATSGVHVTLDGVADDGPSADAHTNVLPDVENVQGTPGPDDITGSDGPNALDGALGTDTVGGGAGNDRIDAIDVYHDPDGHHAPNDYQSTQDRVSCGPGKDSVRADGWDVIAADCERVARYRTVTHSDEEGREIEELRLAHLTLRGGDGPDHLVGAKHAPNTILAGAGNDTIELGGRRDEVNAGPGDDRIVGGRDHRVDSIRCGPGRDRVKADRGDRVAADCEVVQRR